MEDWVRYVIETKQDVAELRGQVEALDAKVDDLKHALTDHLAKTDRRFETLSGRFWAVFLAVLGIVGKWVWDRIAG